MVRSRSRRSELAPLEISCTSADCEGGLHCFKKSREMSEAERGRCRYCGVNLVDWDRIHHCNINDAAFTFDSLRYEMIRHHYWHKSLDLKAKNHARRKGREGLRDAVRHRLEKYIAPEYPVRDGRQTPWEGSIIYYAQHATACCCRKCMEYWYGIPRGIELSDELRGFFLELIMMYIDERMPDLTEKGEVVSPIRRKASA